VCLQVFPVHKTLLIMNVGRILASWEFCTHSEVSPPQPPWLTFHPSNGKYCYYCYFYLV
jgi:hypothetical protein